MEIKIIDKDILVRDLNLLKKIISEQVELDKTGRGLCPFHKEKTQSFHVFQARSQRAKYHCFGCGAQGDIFNYLNSRYNMTFNQATSYLSQLVLDLNSHTSSSLPEPLPTRVLLASSEVLPEEFCEKDCQKYINLREDYEILLEENLELRARLRMPGFQPRNETSTPTQS